MTLGDSRRIEKKFGPQFPRNEAWIKESSVLSKTRRENAFFLSQIYIKLTNRERGRVREREREKQKERRKKANVREKRERVRER